MTLKEGDFIQLKTWFGDVWAEVVWESGNLVRYIRYDKNVCTFEKRLIFTDYVRKSVSRAALELSNKFRTDIIYARDGYWRYGERICGE